MDIKELKDKTTKELDKLLADLREKLRVMRFKVASKQLTDVREIREVKKTIAQILTLKSAAKKNGSADAA